MSIEKISPQQAQQLLQQGAILLDIRNTDEYRYEHIQQAHNIPLSQLNAEKLNTFAGKTVIFHCQAGQRTDLNQTPLQQCSGHCRQVYLLNGGINAWKDAGLEVQKSAKAPLPLIRQVQIAAGFFVLLGVLLGTFIHPWFYALAGLVGIGLMIAGLSGFCGMALLLAKMPWNKV